MRSFLFIFFAAALLSAPVQAASPSDGETVKPQIVIAPHRAVYKMTLANVKNGSSIGDVSGKMYFDWSDSCDGWAVQQRLLLHFSYAEGEDSDVSSTVVTWESKDGKRYNFNLRRLSDGKETDNYRGKATMDGDGGVVHYTVPKDKKDISLPAKTLFPSAHTVLILQRAMAGEKLFTKRVFDGSDEEGAADVSAFIGPKLEHLQDTETNPNLKSNPLMLQEAWPVRLAFFKPDTETGEPDYEMDMNLQANGVARYMKLDYGDFSVSGVLESIEPSPATDCSMKD